MHDRSIEDHVRTVLRRDGNDLTLNITAQELERRLALRRRARVGQRVRLVAAGLAVVAIGGIVAAGNGWIGGRGGQAIGGKPGETTQTAASPTPAPTDLGLQPESARPDVVTSPSPTANDELPCEPLDPANDPLPSVGGGAYPGDSIGHGGTLVASLWNGVGSGSPGTWAGLSDNADSIAIAPPTTALEIASTGCFRSVTAEALLAVYAQAPTSSPTPIPLRFTSAPWPSRVVRISPPPTGGWTVRVRATFVTTDGSDAWSESLFRVFVPFEAPTLTMSPAGRSGGVSVDGSCPSFHLASGASASDQCGGPYAPIIGVDPLVIARGSSVDMVLADGWQFGQVKITAVDADLVAAGKNAPEYSVAFFDKGGAKVTTPVVLDPGSWIVRVSLNGGRGDDSFGAWYDLPVTIRPLS